MPADMKRTIAEAAIRLLDGKNVRKLTVKDIVSECHITRQTFYYHFEDIPHLLYWILEQNLAVVKKEADSYETAEERLRYLFQVAINLKPQLEKTMQTNYADELEFMLRQQVNRAFEEMINDRSLYPTLSRDEKRLMLRYHTHAVMGIIRDWKEEDNAHLDETVHTICEVIEGRIPIKPQA